jgi:hypothetical protein
MIRIQVTKNPLGGYKITKLTNAVVIDAPTIGPRGFALRDQPNKKFRIGDAAEEVDVQHWIGCPDTEVTVLPFSR